ARCTWVGFVVAFRESNLYSEVPNWRRHGYEVILALAALIILVPVVLKQSDERKTEEPPVAVLSTTDKWIVIGVDGVSLDLLQRFSANGDLPNFNRLLSESFVSKLQIDNAGVPPVAWTTVATGVTPEEHGILMPEVRRLGGLSSWMQMTPFELAFHSVLMHAGLGQRQPVSGYMRQTKAFWEILSDSGIQTGIVNWWGSWPARSLRGWNVSERYYYKLASRNRAQDDTFPPEIFTQYRSLAGKTDSKINGSDLDRFYTSVFKSLSQRMPVRVAALYLPGFDILNYEFVERKQMDAFTYTAQYREHLKWFDQQLGEIAEFFSDSNLCIILSAGRSLPGNSGGVLIHGPESWKKGLIQNRAFAERSITPLILYTCGVPVSRSMNGDLLQAVLPQQFLAHVPVRTVNAYVKKD
ncbi:alkaline phosphatase family protein, partial [bacterium]|nr:alkaline phosphatase family protein [bacterium]